MNETTPTTPVTVEVTQRDIDNAIRKGWLPLSLTKPIDRRLKRGLLCIADDIEITIMRRGSYNEVCKIPSPPAVVEFVQAMRKDASGRPFTFTLDLPTACLNDSAILAQETDDASN